TGRTGRLVVEQALDDGRVVTAVVRDPSKLALRNDMLSVVRADVMIAGQLKGAVDGADAVLVALGATSRKDTSRIQSIGTAAVIEAMTAVGARRLEVISAAPVAEVGPTDKLVYQWLARPLLRAVFRDAYADMATMERAIEKSDLDWTVFRPPQLLDRPRTGKYRVNAGSNVPGGYRIGRADLADAMLAAIDDKSTFRQFLGVAY
ncbi:MAG: NAD(P)H-binding protein, partial [Sciscionella sp.]|nr:NAD(P)H-binding protein [Sciscionella sp.]